MLKYLLIFLLFCSCTKIVKEEVTPSLNYELGKEIKTNDKFNGKPIFISLQLVTNVEYYATADVNNPIATTLEFNSKLGIDNLLPSVWIYKNDNLPIWKVIESKAYVFRYYNINAVGDKGYVLLYYTKITE